ncbi:MAG: 3-deoxy-D-manno-octulosonic acid transferase [Vicinamibacterales bacterium]
MSAWARVLFGIYAVAMEIVVWLVLAPMWLVRAKGSAAARAELHMRLGRTAPVSAHAAPTVLLHAVSLGEVNAAVPLIDELTTRGIRVVLSTGTAAGFHAAETLRMSRPTVDAVTYLPWDRRGIQRWLSRVAPSAVVVVETEIWPHLFHASHRLDIPLVMVNARLRSADVPRYRLVRSLFSYVLGCVTTIGARSPIDRDRYVAIGADADTTLVVGCLKTDAALALASRQLTVVALPPLTIVAGSTHPSEEALLLEALRVLDARQRGVRLVLAPRHIKRAVNVLTLARRHGARAALWSEDPPADWEVLIVDSYGDLPRFYAGAALVILGGTFSRIGGHNLLEAAVLGRPVIVGPDIEHITNAVDAFVREGAVVRASAATPGAIADACRQLLDDSTLAERIGRRAAAVCLNTPRTAPVYADIVRAAIMRDAIHDHCGQQDMTGNQRRKARRKPEEGLGQLREVEGGQHDGDSHADRGRAGTVEQ